MNPAHAPIRLGIVGRNFVVDWMLAAAALVPELKPVAVCSRARETGEAFAKRYDLPMVFTSMEEMVSCDEIDAVYLASPILCHYEQAKCALTHGKHVLCEKTACANAGQLSELLELAREHHVVFLEAMRFVYDDALPILKEHLPDIGRVRMVRFDMSQYSSRYDRFLQGDIDNAFRPELCNAAITDLGCYPIHGIISLFGKPLSVSAQAVHLSNGFQGTGMTLLRYPDFLAEATYSKLNPGTPSLILGERGILRMDSINRTTRLTLVKDGAETDLGYEEKQPNNLMFELSFFARCVLQGIRPDKQNRDSLWTLEVLDEARRQTGTCFPTDAW